MKITFTGRSLQQKNCPKPALPFVSPHTHTISQQSTDIPSGLLAKCQPGCTSHGAIKTARTVSDRTCPKQGFQYSCI